VAASGVDMKFKIPEKLELTGKLFRVVFADNLLVSDILGRTDFVEREICLHKGTEGRHVPAQEIENTFWHEITHCILNDMGEDELNGNEKFVTMFSNLLHQAIKTME
jgi:hypothetical protein